MYLADSCGVFTLLSRGNQSISEGRLFGFELDPVFSASLIKVQVSTLDTQMVLVL